jgi:quaternary ammonium compound-resistance protein SugE
MNVPTLSSGWAWGVLITAGVLECAWAIGIKHSAGFARLGPSLWTIPLMIASLTLLVWSARTLPIGTAYAVWTGIGAAGTALAGILLFNEPATTRRLLFLMMIVVGVVGLKLNASR